MMDIFDYCATNIRLIYAINAKIKSKNILRLPQKDVKKTSYAGILKTKNMIGSIGVIFSFMFYRQ